MIDIGYYFKCWTQCFLIHIHKNLPNFDFQFEILLQILDRTELCHPQYFNLLSLLTGAIFNVFQSRNLDGMVGRSNSKDSPHKDGHNIKLRTLLGIA